MLTLKEIEKGCSGLSTNRNLVWVNAKCERCGAQLQLDTSVVLTTYPPQYSYVCSECHHAENSFIKLPEWWQESDINYYLNKITYWEPNSATTLRENVVSIVGNSLEEVHL